MSVCTDKLAIPTRLSYLRLELKKPPVEWFYTMLCGDRFSGSKAEAEITDIHMDTTQWHYILIV
jgi:hypothetical protein